MKNYLTFVEYQISEVMLKKLKDGKCVDFLGKKENVDLIDFKRVIILLESLKNLSQSEHTNNVFGCNSVLNDLEEIYKRVQDKIGNFSNNEQMFGLMLELGDAIQDATALCSKIVLTDWKQHLTALGGYDKTLSKFSFIVRSVNHVGYKNERDYPIISASLFTDVHNCLYNKRRVAFIIEPDENNLIMMSRLDSNTAKNDYATLYDVPFSSKQFAITDAFNDSDRFELFNDYVYNLNADNTGELIFDSSVAVNGVLVCSNATEPEIDFARGYASTYGLPVLHYDVNKNVVTGKFK